MGGPAGVIIRGFIRGLSDGRNSVGLVVHQEHERDTG